MVWGKEICPQLWSEGQQTWGLTQLGLPYPAGGLAGPGYAGGQVRECWGGGEEKRWYLGLPDVTSPAGSDWLRASLSPGESLGRVAHCPLTAGQAFVLLWLRGRGQARPSYPIGRLSMCLGHWR